MCSFLKLINKKQVHIKFKSHHTWFYLTQHGVTERATDNNSLMKILKSNSLDFFSLNYQFLFSNNWHTFKTSGLKKKSKKNTDYQ